MRAEKKKRRTTVNVVGAGRLGTALARALSSAGYDVRAVVNKTAGHARRAARLVASKPRALSASQLSLLPDADLVILSVPDDALPRVADELAASLASKEASLASVEKGKGKSSVKNEGRRPRRARVALHASGALSSDVLAPLRARGFAVGSMHPLASVSADAEAGAESLRAAFYCVEGDAGALRAARRAVRDLGGRSFSIQASDKALYHAAAVVASGHTVALFDLAARTLALCGLSQRRARQVLLPLLASTLSNLSHETPPRALTGTFARADVETVRKHLAALRARRGDDTEADALATYTLLGRHSLRLTAENGADAVALKRIAQLLREEK
ncbi:MAG TPA: Rossmann-like and DUF2520 domain-containing protein [Pyrinomonadaceae bacterium]|nr:Rossmann-like and DUF2520 domain-containing protein [Pyrinomonadaceae bacterium]